MVTRVQAVPIANYRQCPSTQLLPLQRLLLSPTSNRLAQKMAPKGGNDAQNAVRFKGSDVRRLLWSCRDELATLAASPQAQFMSAGDFCASEVPRLGQVRDVWLDSPDPEYHGRTPRSIIVRERRRLPEGIDPGEAIVDHDCPLCQMMADGLSGPVFWHLDGCNMDSDFAFSFHATSEEWEAEQREYEEFNRKFEAEREECERLGVKYPGAGYADPDVV
jgi:hypothetical protein